MSNVLIRCMQGIGDQIYSRPFIRRASLQGDDVYVRTTLPELYRDLNVKLVDPGSSTYRTQRRAYDSSASLYEFNPPQIFNRYIDYHYGNKELKLNGIVSHMEQAFGFTPAPILDLNLPRFTRELSKQVDELIADRPLERIAIVRPVTQRREWYCETRSPEPRYIGWCARMLRDAGYYVISIADCEPEEEWIEGDEPPAHLKLHHGELGIYGTLELIKRATVVVGGSGFIIPASVAAGVNLFVIFGGRGEYDNPHKVFDLRMNLTKIGWALPDHFCRCNKMVHTCDKTISTLDDQFFRFMSNVR